MTTPQHSETATRNSGENLRNWRKTFAFLVDCIEWLEMHCYYSCHNHNEYDQTISLAAQYKRDDDCFAVRL